jgi:hypothetical protein
MVNLYSCVDVNLVEEIYFPQNPDTASGIYNRD